MLCINKKATVVFGIVPTVVQFGKYFYNDMP